MEIRNKVLQLIFDAVDEANNEFLVDKKLKKSPDTVLYGDSGELDSLGLVTLVSSIERKIADEFKISLTLADEKALSMENSPFRTIQSLTDYIISLLEKNENV